MGISTGGTASFSISVSKSASSGGWVSDPIDASRASKPMMYGTGYTYRIKVVEYDRYTNDYLRTYYLNSVYISAEGARGAYYFKKTQTHQYSSPFLCIIHPTTLISDLKDT